MIISRSWILRILSAYRWTMISLTFLTISVFVISAAFPIAVQRLIDHSHAVGNSIFALNIALVLGLAAAEIFLVAVRDKSVIGMGVIVDRTLSYRIFRQWLRADLSYFEGRSANQELNLFYEMQSLRDFVLRTIPIVCFDIVGAVIGLLIIAYYNIALSLAIGSLCLFFAWYLQKSYKVFFKNASAQIAREGERASFVHEVLFKMTTVRREVAEGYFLWRWRGLTRAAIAAVVETSFSHRRYSIIGLTFTRAIYTCAAIFAAFLFYRNQISTGEIVAILILTARVSAPIQGSVGIVEKFQQINASVQMLNAMAKNVDRKKQPADLLKGVTQIQFERVGFQYSSSAPRSLFDINTTLPETGLIVIIGRNGSGKSTFLRAIVGEVKATEGRVTLNGIDIQDISRRAIYKCISYTGQEQVLFTGSLLDNLTFGRFHKEKSVEEAISFGNLTDRLPGGLEALREAQWAGEAGLSGGEQQKLTLARLRLRNTDAFILDEPTAHLDANSIVRFSTQLATLSRSNLVVVATHEPAIMRLATRILVMDSGCLVAEGTFEEISRSSAFQASGLTNY